MLPENGIRGEIGESLVDGWCGAKAVDDKVDERTHLGRSQPSFLMDYVYWLGRRLELFEDGNKRAVGQQWRDLI